MINGCGVLYKDQLFACLAVPDSETGIKFKCGQCQAGVVLPKIGEICAVCGARVQYIDDGPRRPTVTEPPTFGLRPDLEAIRAYIAKSESKFLPLEWGADNTFREAIGVAKELLAEVDRMRAIWECIDCFMERYHDAEAGPCVTHQMKALLQ